MCSAGRAYTGIQKAHKRHTRPRAVRTVRLRVTEWKSGQWQRNAECSRQLAQNFPKGGETSPQHDSLGRGRGALPPTPETYWGGGGRPRTAEARRCGAGGSKGVTTGCGRWRVAPCARYSFRASGGRWRCSRPTFGFARDARTDVRGAETRERKRRYRRIPSACGERATKRAAPARARAGSAINRTVGTARRAHGPVRGLPRLTFAADWGLGDGVPDPAPGAARAARKQPPKFKE